MASMNNIFNLQNKVVILTGGSGQLGKQYCRSLIQAGAKVAIFDSALTSDTEENEDHITLKVDITKRLEIENALKNVIEKWGVPFGLINNAALDSPPNASAEENGPYEQYPESSWDKVMDVNVKGVFLCCQIIGGEIAKSMEGGSIINISSIYGIVSPDQKLYEYLRTPNSSFYKPIAYSASKSAIINMTRYLAVYWADQKVRVNTLTLGGVFNNQDKKFLKGYCNRVPLGRMASEDEYNGAVIFLLSKASSYMTGSNLVIDGGWTAI
jgi:NAD(P)-dependent dehydrogenase (short-subunit alcohol dehydrogenase family)